MIGWVLAALAAGGGLLWFNKVKAQESGGNPWLGSFPSLTHEETADALELLNFKPFTLKMGKRTYGLYLSPSGLTDNDVKTVLATPSGANGPVTAVMRHRTNIPIPGPMTVPVNADMWMVESIYTGPEKTVTPETVARAALAPSTTAILTNPQGVPVAQVSVPNAPPSAVPSTVPASSVANSSAVQPLPPPPVAVSGDGTTVSAIPANKQLGALLYASALSPTTLGRLTFFPIGAKQA
jgi:hypothetical protein